MITKRTGGRYNVDTKLGDFYKFYREMYGNPKDITQKQYNEICKEVNTEVMNLVIFENFGFRIPYKLGDVRVVKQKLPLLIDKDGNLLTKFLPVDYEATAKMWKENTFPGAKKTVVFIFNEHTNGYRCKFWWDKTTSYTRNQHTYFFKPLRKYSRLLAKAIKSGNSKLDYLELNKRKLI